jgi:hypothetical protein
MVTARSGQPFEAILGSKFRETLEELLGSRANRAERWRAYEAA